MGLVIKQLSNVINIIEDTKPAGEQTLYTLSTTCVAKPVVRDPYDIVQFLDDTGMPTASVTLDGLLKFQDLAGPPTLWVGTLDAFIDKMNDTYFTNSVTVPPSVGGALEATQLLVKTAVESIDTKVATQTTLAALLVELQLKADLTETQPVSLATVPLPTGAATQTTLAALLTELQLKADLTETQPVSVVQSRLTKLEQEANDLQKTFTFLSAGTADERVGTIVYSGTTTPVTTPVTKTFVYTGGPGTYLLSTITLS